MNYLELLNEKVGDSKYKKWYINLCKKAIERQGGQLTNQKIRSVKKTIGYVEKHHILPKCLCDSQEQINDNSNLVLFTAKEHYIAHLLLWKATDLPKLAYAVRAFIMNNSRVERNIKLNSNIFNTIREESSMYISQCAKERLKHHHNRKGVKLSDETKEKISNSLKGLSLSNETKEKIKNTMLEKYESGEITAPNLGRTWDDEYKKKMSKSCSKIKKTDEWNKKNSLANKGRVHIANIKTKERKRPLKEDAEKLVNESNGEWIYLHTSKPIPSQE